MRIAFFYCFFLLVSFSAMAQENPDYIKVSQEMLYAVRTGVPVDSFIQQLAKASPESLAGQLKTDSERKAFWLNIYNAHTQVALGQDPGAYRERNKFFTKKFIRIAGETISLDLIEHGILRRSKAKYSFGHFNKLFKSRFEKRFRVETLDYRIHFALNCGATSCPPIAFYQPARIDQQLDLATKTYLKREVLFTGKDLTVKLPAILSWFRGDFGGKKGILKLLQEQKLVPDNTTPRIHWKKYNWDLQLQNFDS